MSNLVSRVNDRLVELRLNVDKAYRDIAKAEKIAAKEKQPIPRHQMDQLVAAVNYAKLEVRGCEITLAAVSKYPPLRSY